MAEWDRNGFRPYDDTYPGELRRGSRHDDEAWLEYDAEFRDWARLARRTRRRELPDEAWDRRPRGEEQWYRERRSGRDRRAEGWRVQPGYPGHRVPRDYYRYLSREEYGLGGRGPYDRDYSGRERAYGSRAPRGLSERAYGSHAPGGPSERAGEYTRARTRPNHPGDRPRNALFGGEAFRRYDWDYDMP